MERFSCRLRHTCPHLQESTVCFTSLGAAGLILGACHFRVPLREIGIQPTGIEKYCGDVTFVI